MIILPADPRKYTDPCSRLVSKVNARFPAIATLGIYNRRKISDSTSWSQHSWGNAVDLTSPSYMMKPPLYASAAEAAKSQYAPHMAYMDAVYLWVAARNSYFDIRYKAWRRYMHYNHIHVDFNPKQYGVPPVLGPMEDDVKFEEYLKGVQASLNKAGYVGASGQPLDVDGIYGANTQFAMEARDFEASLSVELPTIQIETDTVRVVKGVRLV